MNEVDDLDLIAAQPINQAIALNEEFADVRIVFFRNDSAPLGELPEGTSCVAGLSHQSCCVPW